MRPLILVLAVAVAAAGAWWWRRGGPAASEPGSAPAAGATAEAPRLGGEIDPELLAILACPLDKQPVQRTGNYLVCQQCQRHYPIRDGIPVMLVDEALTAAQAAAAP